jgi:arsenate reductase
MADKKKILVLCTGNSCRSQMADGFLKHYAKEEDKNVEIYSAGTETHGVNPLAIKVMLEKEIDLSDHTSDLVDDYLHSGITHLISVCDHAIEVCPVFPEKVDHMHHTFNDPAKASGAEDEILNSFRKIRDEIESFCSNYIKETF